MRRETQTMPAFPHITPPHPRVFLHTAKKMPRVSSPSHTPPPRACFRACFPSPPRYLARSSRSVHRDCIALHPRPRATKMVMVHIFYGDSGSGKSRAAQQLASELKAAHGWDYGHYYRTPFVSLAPVLIIDDESEAMGVDMFNSLASSGSPFRRRSPRLFFQQEETQVVQALIVCMHVNGPSPIAREVPCHMSQRSFRSFRSFRSCWSFRSPCP